MILAHAPISYLANEFIQKKSITKLKFNEQLLVAIFSLIFGILPDFDLFLKNSPGFIHHNLITHTPIFYILIWLLLKLLSEPIYRALNKKSSAVLDRNLINILINTFLIATLVHLLCDFLVSSIMIFYPLWDTKVYLFKYIFEHNLYTGYVLSPLFAIEIIIIATFIYAIYRKFFLQRNTLTTILKTLIFLSIIYLIPSIYISLNTYNKSYMRDSDGNINYDVDYDTLIDSDDMDVGNTGENNIVKARESKILDSALDIINSKKWTSNHSSLVLSSLKYRFGGFNSYRLISQTYYSIGLPIEPVLRDYDIKKSEFDSYSKTYDYETLLFEYLKENDLLIELNLDATVNLPSSKLFFLEDEKGNILNLGITLEGNYLAIVFDGDSSLAMHSYEFTKEYYEEQIKKIYIQN